MIMVTVMVMVMVMVMVRTTMGIKIHFINTVVLLTGYYDQTNFLLYNIKSTLLVLL